MDDPTATQPGTGPTVYACPMHPDVTGDQPGRCPQCGMKLLASATPPAQLSYACPMHPDVTGDQPGRCPRCGMKLLAAGQVTQSANMHWKFVDRTTGAATTAIDWRFTVRDRVKIRLVNEMDSDHPMHHPFHLHGAGRFLVLARDGEPEHNLVWKDTVLVHTGQIVDILFDVTNPGLWMAHCHIAEHMQSAMMFSFTVDTGAGL
jgi:FtsP/CotA-like multicopper oxidase with cupredoxin domain